jgi:PKD repeat protein
MKFRFFLSLGVLGWSFFSLSFYEVQATSSPVTLAQLQISGATADDEFVRLRNETGSDINLSGFRLSKKTLSNGVCKESTLVSSAHFQGLLLGKSTFLITHPSYKSFYSAPLDYSSASYYLTENTVVLLYDQNGDLLDRKVSGTACDDVSPLPEPLPPVPSTVTVRFNELLPNPSSDEGAGEFIELYNPETTIADMSGCSLRDASKTGSYTFPQDTLIPGHSYFVLTRSVSKLSLNNTDETLTLFDSAGNIIDSMSYETAKENISLNNTSSGWRGGTPTPGLPNDTNTLPETRERVPQDGYRKVAITFNARGKDADGEHLKFTWDFGDGHKSYKEKTTHSYEKNGTYTVTLKTTDGSDDVIETFTIKITSLPKPNIRITALMPNPSGNDSKAEWMTIENRGKKAIDLQGFSIATGSKKLTNHPIRESLIIKPGKSVSLTSAVSRFTLPNQKGKIELRAPDGKVLQKIRYTLSKAVPEGSVYKKEKGTSWKWEKKGSTKVAQQAPPTIPAPIAPKEIPPTIVAPTPETPPTEPVIPPTIQNDSPDSEETPPEEETEEQQVLGVTTTVESSPTENPSLSFSFFKNIFFDLNAFLNHWQNKK